ncbi:hypothetical protein BH24ACI3_BH24ACI3_16060 [soil metagenome]
MVDESFDVRLDYASKNTVGRVYPVSIVIYYPIVEIVKLPFEQK